jgi:hypothetical protein
MNWPRPLAKRPEGMTAKVLQSATCLCILLMLLNCNKLNQFFGQNPEEL